MDSCCICGSVKESNERAASHVFVCRHFLCKQCLESFGEGSLRSVCFTCGSPPVEDTPRSPFEKEPKDSGKGKTNNPGSIIGDCPTKKRAVPAEFIYDRDQLEISNISLSSPRTGAGGQSKRMEGGARSPRKTSSSR